VTKINGEKKIMKLNSAAANLEFIEQLEGDKQMQQGVDRYDRLQWR